MDFCYVELRRLVGTEAQEDLTAILLSWLERANRKFNPGARPQSACRGPIDSLVKIGTYV